MSAYSPKVQMANTWFHQIHSGEPMNFFYRALLKWNITYQGTDAPFPAGTWRAFPQQDDDFPVVADRIPFPLVLLGLYTLAFPPGLQLRPSCIQQVVKSHWDTQLRATWLSVGMGECKPPTRPAGMIFSRRFSWMSQDSSCLSWRTVTHDSKNSNHVSCYGHSI